MSVNALAVLQEVRMQLERSGIFYEVAIHSDQAVMLKAAVPGERWEIEINLNGEIALERFRSDGTVSDAVELDKLVKDQFDADM